MSEQRPYKMHVVDRGWHEMAVLHARKQGAADGFQAGWHGALERIRQGDDPDDLAALVPNPAKGSDQ